LLKVSSLIHLEKIFTMTEKVFIFIMTAIFLMAISPSLVSAASTGIDDNVIIDDEISEYKIVENKGAIECVKAKIVTTYLARRSDASIAAVEFYDNSKKINKASAPGAKAIYRSWESGDIFYSGARVCVLPVDLEKGKPAKVKFEWTITDPAQFCNIYLTQAYYTRHMVTRLEVPLKLADIVKVKAYNFPDGMELESIREKDGRIIYTVEANGLRAQKDEKMAVSTSISAPQLIITGQFRDYNDVYRHLHSYIDDTAPTDEMSRLSEMLTASAPDTISAIDSIAGWVRENIRYVAIEHGDYGVRPAAASEVLANMYGDCKGSANLIKSLLNASGIDGRLVWIGVRNLVPHKWSEVPSMLSGNHCIAAAVLSDTIIYADGTARFCPAGYLPPSIRGMEALIENGNDGCILCTVPDVQAGSIDVDSISGLYRITGEDLTGRLEHKMGGLFKMQIAGLIHSSKTKRHDDICRHLLAFPKKNVDVDSLEFEMRTPWSAFASIRGHVVEKGSAKHVGDAIFVDIRPLRDIYSETVESRDRTRDIELFPSYSYEVDLLLEIPEGYVESDLPGRLSADSPWFTAYVEYAPVADGSGRRLLRCRASMRKLRLSAKAEEVDEYNKAVRDMRRMTETRIKLVKCI